MAFYWRHLLWWSRPICGIVLVFVAAAGPSKFTSQCLVYDSGRPQGMQCHALLLRRPCLGFPRWAYNGMEAVDCCLCSQSCV